MSTEDEIRQRIDSLGVRIKKMDVDYDLTAGRRTIRCEVKFKKDQLFDFSQKIVQDLTACPGVSQVKWMS